MNRNKIYLTIIILLISINIGYWSFFHSSDKDNKTISANNTSNISTDDFLLPITTEKDISTLKRDVFFISNRKQKTKVTKQVKAINTKPALPSEPKLKASIQPKISASVPKLIGIVFHKGHGSALINYADKNHILAIDDEIDGRYQISAIEHKTVKIYDTITKQSLTLQVSK